MRGWCILLRRSLRHEFRHGTNAKTRQRGHQEFFEGDDQDRPAEHELLQDVHNPSRAGSDLGV